MVVLVFNYWLMISMLSIFHLALLGSRRVSCFFYVLDYRALKTSFYLSLGNDSEIQISVIAILQLLI